MSDPQPPVDLAKRHCKACEGGVPALTSGQIAELLRQLHGWSAADGRLTKAYRFRDFYQTMSFVNAVAWIANTENHHPDLEVGYNTCRVHYSTHAVGGLTENDFICAARIDALLTSANESE